MLVSLTITLLLYGSALTLPFYSDDLLQVVWVEATPLADLWRSVGPYQDYRPLHFALWRLLYLLGGDLRPVVLHALNLAGHVLCGLLVGLFAARLEGRPRQPVLLATAFFVIFPFAFDAIPWAIGFSYPLMTALALGALLAYLRARQGGSLPHHLLAVALTALAGFAHEGGAVVGLLILTAELSLLRREGRSLLWLLPHLAASGLSLAAGILVRPQGTVLHGLVWPDLAYNIAYAFQALLFPVAPLAGLLARAGLDPILALGIVGLPALLVLTWRMRRALGAGPLFLAAGWWAIASLPPVLTLRFDWLSDAPRTLYPAAVGTAIVWAGGLGGGWRAGRAVLATTAAALFCLAPAAWFVLGRVSLQQQVGGLLWEVVEAAREDGRLLVVNLPSRITPSERFYPFGHEGVIPMPPQVGADDLVAAHTGRTGAAFERAWGPVLPSLPYAVRPLGDLLAPDDLRAAERIALVVYRPEGMALEEAGAILSSEEAPSPLARFEEKVWLLSCSCSLAASQRLILSTCWQVQGQVVGSPTVFAHLVGSDGRLLAQADGDPLLGLYPFSVWRIGERVCDIRTFEGADAGPATVALGVWDPITGIRWEATGPGGEPLPDNAFHCAVP